ncbi:Imm52 family immunity protein [uncultured Herbaspirillum sp.]|uniref:Imm52 family immunity protein n=1 Tax=uncultured Herbaspirillum sp. TaxID=160236 RepID=UPI002638E458|nr:Imm52 family immunity protein [uncultured Herbaspirillum sp.]
MHIELHYPSTHNTLPGVADHLRQLLPLLDWLAIHGIAVESWYAPAAEIDSEDDLAFTCSDPACVPAFSHRQPATAAIAVFDAEDAVRADDGIRPLALWSGEERSAGAFLLHSLCTRQYGQPCQLLLQSQLISPLEERHALVRLVQALVQWWPVSSLEVGIGNAHETDADDAVAESAVWMRYLPKVVASEDVPDGSQLVTIHGIDGAPKGTLILAVDAERFDPASAAHQQAARLLATCPLS